MGVEEELLAESLSGPGQDPRQPALQDRMATAAEKDCHCIAVLANEVDLSASTGGNSDLVDRINDLGCEGPKRSRCGCGGEFVVRPLLDGQSVVAENLERSLCGAVRHPKGTRQARQRANSRCCQRNNQSQRNIGTDQPHEASLAAFCAVRAQ